MDIPEDTTSKLLTVAQVNKEVQSELVPVEPKGFSEDDEDSFSGLSPDVAECLEYLLQTINTVEGEILQDDEGAEDQLRTSNVSANMQQSTSPPKQPVSKMKMIKSLSEESMDIGLRRPDPHCLKAKRSPSLASSHPPHFRKFDTIMRSGVNVQELRSRFLLCHDSSAEVKGPSEAAVKTIKQSALVSGGQKSPRDEALMKLGLLQRNDNFPNTQGPLPVIVSGQHAQMPLAEGLNCEAILSSNNNSGELANRQISVITQEKLLPL